MTVMVAMGHWFAPETPDPAALVDRAVRSVLAQTHEDLVCLVIGDGQAPPLDHIDDPRLVVYNLPENRGAYYALRLALEASPFEWFAPFGADDMAEPDHLETLLELAERDGTEAVTVGKVYWGPETDNVHTGHYEVGCFTKRRLLSFGAWDPTARIAQDTLMLRLLALTGPVSVSQRPTYHRIKRPYSLTTTLETGLRSRARLAVRGKNGEILRRCQRLRVPEDIAVYRRKMVPSVVRDELAAHAEQITARLVAPAQKKAPTRKASSDTGLRVLNASHLADTGGNGIRTAQAFEKLAPDWHYRATARQQNWLEYPADLPWSDALAEWKKADVVHLRDGFQALRMLRAPDRPAVIHHHGTQFRKYHVKLLAEQRTRRAVGLASTLDLYLMAPDDLRWAPALYDLPALAAYRQQSDDDILRIAHAPTNRGVKSTKAFLAAAERLGHELPVEVILIERTPWAECLRRKGFADIYFDQVSLGYGNNAIEAWGMGQAVIAGGAQETLDEMTRRFGRLPFYLADEGSIYEALRALADPDTRAELAAAGRAHAERFHSEPAGVALLQEAYRDAVEDFR